MEARKTTKTYSPEVKERAVRMVLKDLRDRLAVDPEQPGRRSLAQPIDMTRSSHTR
jgi:transposase-like protein